jgi:hypothetical protein
MSETRRAWAGLLDVLAEAGERYAGEEWLVTGEDDVAEAHRVIAHVLQSALYSHAEFDPERPVWRRIVSPTRKFSGDNPDAWYFEAPVRGDRTYRVTGNLAGAVYTAFTVEAGADDGAYPDRTAGVLNDTVIDVTDDGDYEIHLGGEPRQRNWLDLPADAGRITTRHYFEWPGSAAAADMHIPLAIENLDPPDGPPPRWGDAEVAAAIDRVATHVRGKTVDGPNPATRATRPSWVGQVPNEFPVPQPPGDMALAAVDAHYSLARWLLGPDEALVVTGRWPDCRFANVCAWNRFQQALDYVNRPVSRNRADTTLEDDGRFRMVVAHADPGVPNWIDTEGRGFGTLFFRFFLPEGDVEPLVAEVVPFDRISETGSPV